MFTAITASKVSASVSSIVLRWTRAALLTSASTRPKAFRAASTTRAGALGIRQVVDVERGRVSQGARHLLPEILLEAVDEHAGALGHRTAGRSPPRCRWCSR